MGRINRITLVGEKLFLDYNKTAIMHKVIGSLGRSYRFVEINSVSKSKILRQLSYTCSYIKLFLSLGHAEKGQILWVSEFKFTLPHLVCAKIIAIFKQMILVGGPHVLRADAIWLTEPAFQRQRLSMLQSIRITLVNFSDGWAIRLLDVVQSYNPMYAARAISLAGNNAKAKFIFPIGQCVDETISYRPRERNQAKNIKLVFWGVANTLHGLDILPETVKLLRNRGISASVFIYSPANHYVKAVLLDALNCGVGDLFNNDTSTVIKHDYSKVFFADLAISHLVSKNLHPEARLLMNSLGTPNKLFEILALGLPAIAAKSDSLLEAVGPHSCILVEAGEPMSLANAIEEVCAGKIDVSEIARNGQLVARSRYSISAIARHVGEQLDAI